MPEVRDLFSRIDTRAVRVVLLCCLTLVLNNGFMIVGKMFFDPLIIAKLGIPVGTLKFGESISYTTVALAAPASGYLIDRIGPRLLFAAGLLSMAAGLVIYAQATSVVQLYVADVLFGLSLAFSGCYTCVMVISEITIARRGFAIGFLLAVANLGNGIAPPINAALTRALGWQASFYIIAIITILVTPLVALSVPRRLEHIRAARDDQPVAGYGAALRSTNFWCLAMVAALGFMVAMGLLSNVPIYLTRQLHVASEPMSIYMMILYFAGFGSQLLAGFISDRVDGKLFDLGFILTMVVACILFLAMPGQYTGIALALLAIGWGGHYVLLQSFLPRLFAGPAFGRTVGAIALIEAMGASAGPFLIGASYDRTASYDLAFTLGGALLLLTTVFVMLFRMPGRAGHVAR